MQVVPRAIWSGAITFGLVNVPVRMYSAISEHKLHFHWVHEKDESPIGYRKICKLEDKPVSEDEVVKAFEFEPGEYVFMEDEDFEAARSEGYKTIDISDFVPYEQIDPIYFARTYYLGPQEGGEKVYSLLRARWRIRAWPRSRSSSCATGRTWVVSASATASSRSSSSISPTRSGTSKRSSRRRHGCRRKSWRWPSS